MKRITMSLLGLLIVTGAGQARAGEAVEGTLAKSAIREVVRAHINEIRVCYNEGLQRDPQAQGRIVLDFTIGTEGAVTRSEVASSDMADAAVSECMRVAAGTWVFPKPEGGALKVQYPFVLEPG
jgi:TonB family protein